MKLYAVVKADGTIRRNGAAGTGRVAVYDTEGKARNWCRADGDSVVELEVDLNKEPIFIRRKRLEANGA